MHAAGRRRAQKLAPVRMDEVKRTLANEWIHDRYAGTMDEDLEFEGRGGHTCGARITARKDRGRIVSFEGEFDSDGCHAEMDALAAVFEGGYERKHILSIEIEKAPCPRCAVVLNKLGLSDRVTYKSETVKSQYPTWTYPEIGVNWPKKMGIDRHAPDEADQDTLLNFFHSQEWWTGRLG